MADQQKIHPIQEVNVDVDTPGSTTPTAPLVPVHDTSNSDQKLHPDHHDQPHGQYPPFQQTSTIIHSKQPKKRSCCCKCLCWAILILVLLIVIIGAIAGILYLVFRPKLPDFSVDKLEVTQFDLIRNNGTLEATFNVTITVKNPNKKIGIYYEGGSYISVWYISTRLCEGGLPKFYQGHRNTTVLHIPLTGGTDNATGLLTSLQQQRVETGNVPLVIRARQPVRIKLGSLKLFKMKFSVRCRLVVDTISANNQIAIQSSSCKFRFRL